MSMNKGMTSPYQLAVGDVIRFDRTLSPFSSHKERSNAYGLTMAPAGNTDNVVVFEIIPAIEAQKTNRRYVVLQQANALPAYGLPVNKDWAIIIDPITLRATDRANPNREMLYYRLGNMARSPEMDRLANVLENIQLKEQTSGMEGAPRMARKSDSIERIAILHTGQADKQDEVTSHWGLKKIKANPTKYTDDGNILDVSLDKAGQFGLIPQDMVGFFEKPAEKKIQPIRTLRALYNLATKNPQDLNKYVAMTTVNLADIENLHPAILNGLAEPRAGESVLPITTLNEAYALFTQRFEDATKYFFITDKTKYDYKELVIRLYDARIGNAPSANTKDFVQSIKEAWAQYGDDYLAAQRSKDIPERYASIFKTPRDFLMPRKPS
jgi:hypothetical protein